LAWLLVEWAGGPSSLIFGSIVGGLVFGAFAGLIHDPPNRHRNDDTRTEATGPGVWPVA
jgi:hypothetical protein